MEMIHVSAVSRVAGNQRVVSRVALSQVALNLAAVSRRAVRRVVTSRVAIGRIVRCDQRYGSSKLKYLDIAQRKL